MSFSDIAFQAKIPMLNYTACQKTSNSSVSILMCAIEDIFHAEKKTCKT